MARTISDRAVLSKSITGAAVESAARATVEALDSRTLLATTLTITADLADRGVNSNATLQSTGDTSIRVGDNGTNTAERAAVFPFKLPTLPAGAVITNVTASFRLASVSNAGSITGSADVYALGRRATSTVNTSDFFVGAYGTDTTDATKIQSAIVTKTSTAGTKTLSSSGATALTNYLKGQYAAGATPGQFVFLRLNAQSAQLTSRMWTFDSANASSSSNRPVLKITYDVPPPPPTTGSIGGFLWNDTDGDGAVDAGESRTGARTVFIDANGNKQLDTGEKQTNSDANGVYKFTGLPAGTYNITRVFPSGYRLSNDPDGFITIAVAAGQTITNANIGTTNASVQPPPPPADTGAISGFLWNDADSDGVFDTGEARSGIATVFIDGNGNKSLDTGEKQTAADAQGNYSFTGLAAGTYNVTRVFPAGYQMSNGTGGVLAVTLAANQQVTTANIGTMQTPPAQPVAPAAPDQLGTVTLSSSSIQLTWRDNANNETAFVIERSPDGTNFAPAGTVGANTNTFTDTGRAADTKHFYRVRAVNQVNGNTANSANAGPVSNTTLPAFTRTLFVDNSYTGATANGGFATPYKTIASAMATAVAGDGIVVRGGTYYETVSMKSGTPGNPVTLMAHPTERSVISGFSAVTGWQLQSGGTYSTTVNFKPDTLYVGNNPQDMSRTPNEGWFYAPTVTQDTANAQTIVSDPANLAGIPSLVGGYFQAHTKAGNVYGGRQILAHDTVNGTVTLAAWTGLANGDRYMLKNTLDLLDRPGEWAAVQTSTTTWQVFFRPKNVADLNSTQSRKTINRQIHVSNAHDVVIRGLEVTGNTKYGIELGNASGVVIRDNVVHNNGGQGVWVRYSNNVLVKNNVAMGNSTGISVSSVSKVVIDGNEVALNVVDGVIVSGDVSGKQPGAVGFTPTDDVVVSNNYIHHHLGYGHADGIQMYRWVTNVRVLNNFLNFNGQQLMTEQVENAEFAGNLVWNAGAFSVIFGHANSNNWNVHNNTIGGSGYGPYSFTGTGYTVRENITVGQVSMTSPAANQYTGDRNLYFNPYSTTILRTSSPSKNYSTTAAFFTDTAQEQNSVAGNPLFPSAPAFTANMDGTVMPNLSTLIFRNAPTGFVVGDHIQINGDGVVRTVTGVDMAAKSITIDIPLPAKVLSHGYLIENWKTATSFNYDFTLPANSPGRTLSATGGPVGSLVNASKYQAGDFTGDGVRDIPVLASDIKAGLPNPLNWVPPSF